MNQKGIIYDCFLFEKDKKKLNKYGKIDLYHLLISMKKIFGDWRHRVYRLVNSYIFS